MNSLKMVTNHPIVHGELHHFFPIELLSKPYYLPQMNIREGVFRIKKMVTLIVTLENLLINEVICLS